MGKLANDRLLSFAKDAGIAVNLNDVGVRIMRAHAQATGADESGIVGLLTPKEIAGYHHRVFNDYGLPNRTFGGTPVTGALWEANVTRPLWCGGCE